MGRQGVGKPSTTTVAPASGVEGKRAPNPRWTSRKQGTNSGWTNQGIRRENTGKPDATCLVGLPAPRCRAVDPAPGFLR